MAEENNKLSANVDVGLSAKAEIKGEIPSSSMGRLVDALTDVIRPFSEARGLRADQIRLQREDVMIKIAQKAQRRIEIEGGTPNPIPNRILIPLMEKASLIDIDDELLIETWANLMSSASKGAKANHGIFIDILSKIDSIHLEYLHFLSRPKISRKPPDEFLDIGYNIYDFFDKTITPHIEEIANNPNNETPSDEISDKCAAFFRRKGSNLISGFATIDCKSGNKIDYEIHGGTDLNVNKEYIYGALESLNLIERNRFDYNEYLHFKITVHYHVLTLFGMEFFYAGYDGTNPMAIA